jgi:hypothetical protein
VDSNRHDLPEPPPRRSAGKIIVDLNNGELMLSLRQDMPNASFSFGTWVLAGGQRGSASAGRTNVRPRTAVTMMADRTNVASDDDSGYSGRH